MSLYKRQSQHKHVVKLMCALGPYKKNFFGHFGAVRTRIPPTRTLTNQTSENYFGLLLLWDSSSFHGHKI